jgi:Ca2+-binding RTX toxin-like protein
MTTSTVIALNPVYEQLIKFANLDSFWQDFESIYGSQYNRLKADSLRSQWQNQDFSQLPQIEVVSSETLGTARGAYSTATNTIYLSDSLIANSSPDTIKAIILEEIGHFVDAQVNELDTLGDEGEYFSKVVRAVTLSDTELNSIKTEDDHSVITLQGQNINVEQANYDLEVIDKPTSDGDSLTQEDPTDTWNFQLATEAGKASYISLTSDTNGADFTVTLYDEFGTVIAESVNSSSSSVDSEYIPLTGLGAGNYYFVVSDASGGITEDVDYHFTIDATDNPTPPPTNPELSINDVSVIEGDPNSPEAILTVSLSTPSDSEVTVDYELIPGTATAEDDYTDMTGTLIFEPGETSKTISIPIIADNIPDTGETFTVNLSNSENATIAKDSGTVTIIDTTDTSNNTLETTVSTTLPDDVDNLVLLGTDNINGTGNANANTITGNGVDNTISGLVGDDSLFGLGGNDDIIGGDGNDLLVGDGDSATGNPSVPPQPPTGNANVFTPYSGTVSDLTQSILGANSGITINSATYTGANTATSLFSSVNFGATNTSSYVLGSGILMTTGDGQPPLMNTLDYYGVANNLPGDTDIEQIIQNVFPGAGITYDATVLEVTFTTPANTNSISLDVMFGSDEYPEWADTWYVDIAGIIVDGVNYGLFNQNPTQPLSILSQNVVSGNLTDNTTGILPIEYDGMSSPLRVVANLGSGTNHTLKIAIADTGDAIYDSALFVSNLQVSDGTTGVTLINDDTLEGGNGDDTLEGGIGDDCLDGGSGIDDLSGDTGDDTYVVDNSGDTVTESSTIATEIDTVESSVSYILGANIENLILTGTDPINGTGNELNNTITGNSAANILDGSTGFDTLIGGTGNDTYVIDDPADVITETSTVSTEIDEVQAPFTYTLGTNLENLTLTGTTAIDGTGNTANNLITGNSGNNTLNGGDGNDTLNGNGGVDTLIGDTGNDTYIVDELTDIVTETSTTATEIDEVQSSVTYTLGTNLENLTLTGTTAINGTGNSLNNKITGNSAANILDGSTGIDTLIGGLGDDTYVVDSTTDTITEAVGEGTDTVQSSVTFTLVTLANIENLTLTGTTAINGTGNTLNNTITGNSGNNLLSGATGSDHLNGNEGDDTLIGVDSNNPNPGQGEIDYLSGGSGGDRFILGNANWIGYDDGLNNNAGNNDYAEISDFNIAEGDVIQLKGGVNYLLSVSGGDTSLLIDQPGSEPDELIGMIKNRTGLDLNSNYFVYDGALPTLSINDVTITEGNNGTTNATFTVTRTGITNQPITVNYATANGTTNPATAGTDYTAVNGTLTFATNETTKTLTVAIIGDTVVENNETFVVNLTNPTNATLADGQGLGTITDDDTVSGILKKGTTGNDSLLGGTGNDTLQGLAGNDTLNGSTGADSLEGGTGNDIYYVDNIGDIVVEAASAGTDTVNSTVNYTLSTNVEKLTLTGSDNLNGTGNTLANTITGNTGNNILSGGDANDTITGGDGNDSLMGDLGTDSLTGGNGNDTLVGGNGNDTLNGGVGLDSFQFNSLSEGIDKISSYSVSDDTILVSASGFGGGLVAGTLSSAQFIKGTAATTSAHRFIYNSGKLLFDADGNGATSAVQIATLSTGLAMTNADIVVF